MDDHNCRLNPAECFPQLLGADEWANDEDDDRH
jgi:hypothetical protein